MFDMARVARFGSNILCFGHDEIYCKFCIFRISDKVENNNFVVNILKNIDDSLVPHPQILVRVLFVTGTVWGENW